MDVRPSSISGGNYELIFDIFSCLKKKKKVTAVLMFDLEFWLGSIGVGRMGLSFGVDIATS